jgi:hypothetical protein
MSFVSDRPRVAEPRRVFMVLSPRSLGYARYALESLLSNSLEPLHLYLITDSGRDKELLAEEMTLRKQTGEHAWTIVAEQDLGDREAVIYAPYPHLRSFRKGHPCWRKITDPLLLSESCQEMILLDPDLYFPNRFTFEPTLDRGLLLMWQRPNCLFPPPVVCRAMSENIRLARHVDIGVAHWRAPADLDWLNWLLGKLGGANLPWIMHIEAIVWAALAMRFGGGHLHPHFWHCWHRTQTKWMLRKLGVPGRHILRPEPFGSVKCFHAGGEAKNWLASTKEYGWMHGGTLLNEPGDIRPFIELTPNLYRWEQRVKSALERIGYYHAFQSG